MHEAGPWVMGASWVWGRRHPQICLPEETGERENLLESRGSQLASSTSRSLISSPSAPPPPCGQVAWLAKCVHH